MYVNNPAMAAYAEARHLYPHAGAMTVVSVGTGDRQDRITYSAAKTWGLLSWATKIVPVLMDSVSEAVDYELNALPQCRYHRFQVSNLGPASNDLDDVTPQNLANLQAVARDYVSSVSSELDEICAELS